MTAPFHEMMTAQRVISFLVPTGLLIIGLLLQGCDPSGREAVLSISTDASIEAPTKAPTVANKFENNTLRWGSSTMVPITKGGKYPQYIEQYVNGIQDYNFIGDGQQYFTNEGSHPNGRRQIKNKSHGGDFEQHTIQHTGGYQHHTKQYDNDEENYTSQGGQRATQSRGDDNQQNTSVDEHALIETNLRSSTDELTPMASLTAFARTSAPWSVSAVVISMCFCFLWWLLPCGGLLSTRCGFRLLEREPCMCARMGPASQFALDGIVLPIAQGRFVRDDRERPRMRFVRREVRLLMLTTVLACVSALAASQFTAGRNVPTAMPATGLLPLVRTSVIDKQLTGRSWCDLLKKDFKALPKSPFMMSKLEVFDAFTDGIAIAEAIRLDINNESFHKHWVESWEQGSNFARYLAPLARTLRLPGWMILAQASAMILQVLFAHNLLREDDAEIVVIEVAAEIAGLGAFSEEAAQLREMTLNSRGASPTVHQQVEKQQRSSHKMMGQVLFEAAPQLALQVSLLMAASNGATGPVTVSICIGIAMTLIKAVGMLMLAFPLYRRLRTRLYFVPPLLTFAILALTVAWLIGWVVCPEHSFNVSAMHCDHFDS